MTQETVIRRSAKEWVEWLEQDSTSFALLYPAILEEIRRLERERARTTDCVN